MGWLYTDFYIPWKEKRDSQLSFFTWASIENKHFSKEFYETEQSRLSPQEFARRYQGRFEKMAGLIWDIPAAQVIAPLEKNTKTDIRIMGIDWGFRNPAAIVVVYVKDNAYYVVDEWKASERFTEEILQVAKNKTTDHTVTRIFPDPEDPENIEKARQAGLPVYEASKEVQPGCLYIGTLIREKRFFVTHNCQEFLDEASMYHWKETEEGKIPKEEPEKVNDHLCAAVRYAVYSTQPIKPKQIATPPREPYYVDIPGS
jgi:hypothetical protein